MPDERPTSDDLSAETASGAFPEDEGHEPLGLEAEDLDDPEQLPRRPRQRLLTPIPVALMLALMTAVGFIGGVLVEKGESASSSTGASALSALRGGLGRGSGRSGTGGAGAGGAGGSAAAFLGGTGVAGGSRTVGTVGTVAFVDGSTLYVTNTQGTTLKVTTAPGATITKTVNTSLKSIHPGEAVTITGSAGANGALSAEAISEGSGAGGLAALLGGSGRSSGGSGGGSSGGGPALFGGG